MVSLDNIRSMESGIGEMKNAEMVFAYLDEIMNVKELCEI